MPTKTTKITLAIIISIGAIGIGVGRSEESPPEPKPLANPPEAPLLWSIQQRKGVADAQLSAVTGIQHFVFQFDEKNGNAGATQRRTATVPAGSTHVAVAVAGYTLYFQTSQSSGTLKRRGVGQILVYPGVEVSGSTVTVKASALLTDENKDDAWGGQVVVQAIFYQ